MAAMKQRGGEGPLEVVPESRPGQYMLRIPVEGGGRLQVQINLDEAQRLLEDLKKIIKK